MERLEYGCYCSQQYYFWSSPESDRQLKEIAKGFQRPFEEGIQILNAVQDVYLDTNITIA